MRREKGTGSWGTVTKRGITYYRFRKLYPGMTNHKEFTGRTKAEVKRKVQEFESKSVHITNSDFNKMTLEQCIENVLNVLEPTFKTNNYATLQATFRCYIKTNKIADVQMGSIDTIMIQDYYSELSKKYSESTVKKTRTLFNTVFDYLVSCNIMSSNPAKGIKMPHTTNYAVQKKEHSFLSLEQADKFYETALMKADEVTAGVRTGDYIYGRNARFCLIVLYTGMRIGEAYGLTWNDVDFKRNVIRINKTKDFTSRIIESKENVLSINGVTCSSSNLAANNVSATNVNVSSRINADAATAIFNNVYVKDELRSTTWAIDNITNLGSTFYVSPCIIFTNPSVYINSKSGTTVTLTITDSAIISSRSKFIYKWNIDC